MSGLVSDELGRLLDELAERIAGRLVQLQHEQGSTNQEEGGSPWMAIERAAAYLDLPKQRLYRLTASGEIPHYKQEGRLLFNRGELDAWLRRFGQGERAGWATARRASVASMSNSITQRKGHGAAEAR
jgi:excisionase family DNA binding protein